MDTSEQHSEEYKTPKEHEHANEQQEDSDAESVNIYTTEVILDDDYYRPLHPTAKLMLNSALVFFGALFVQNILERFY